MISAGCFLFGSSARGDADSASDTDVLIVYEREPSPLDRQRAKELVIEQFRRESSFAEYTWQRLAAMFADGHLFAWHLYHEARPLRVFGVSDRDFSFPKPAPYRSSRRDALNFVELLGSCVRAIEGRTASMVYEAGLGYVAIRNVGMSLSALALARPEFDRHVPFKVARVLLTPPPCDCSVYDLMVTARHSSQRGLDEPNLDVSKLLCALIGAREWAEEALEIVHDITVV
jgi:predicted nucleotidyltransferase